jgi:hypothetical protein
MEIMKRALLILIVPGMAMLASPTLAAAAVQSPEQQLYQLMEGCEPVRRQQYLERLRKLLEFRQGVDPSLNHFEQRKHYKTYHMAIKRLGNEIEKNCPVALRAD